MANGTGGGAALSAQYGRGPIDVAGKVASKTDSFLKEQQAKVEKEKLDKENKEKDLTKMYDDKVAKIIVGQDAPPKAKEIATIAGDEIYKLSKDGKLKGIELSRAIDRVTEDANAAISDITGAANSKAKGPKDAFYVDGEFGNASDSMMKGDCAFSYTEGRGGFKCTGGQYSVSEYGAAIGQENTMKQINIKEGLTALAADKSAYTWDLKKPEGQAAWRQRSSELSNSNFNGQNAGAGARFIYNNVNLGEDKAAFLEVGKKMAIGGYDSLTVDEKAMYDKYKQNGQELYEQQLNKGLVDVKPTDADPNAGVPIKDDKTYIDDTTRLIYGKNGGAPSGFTKTRISEGLTKIFEKVDLKKDGAQGKIGKNTRFKINHSGTDWFGDGR